MSNNANVQKARKYGQSLEFGTKKLLDHMKHCKLGAAAQSKTIKSYYTSTKTTLSKPMLEAVKQSQAKMISGCHLAFNLVENETFKSFVQQMVNLGAQYGCVKVDDVLYGRKTIQKRMLDIAKDLQAKIKQEIICSALDGCVSMVTDKWSDNVV